MTLDQEINASVSVLRKDGVILMPTDTIWGLGANVFSEKAYARMMEIKDRPADQKFVLLVTSLKQLKIYVEDIHPRVETLLQFLQRPLTLIYPEAKNLPSYAVAQDGSIAIRIVSDPFVQTMIHSLGHPICSSSANMNGQATPKHFGQISYPIISQADYIFDYRRDEKIEVEPSVIARYNDEGVLDFIRSKIE